MPDIHYETNCGQFVLHRDGKPVGAPLDELGLAVQRSGPEVADIYVMKHGAPAMVLAWAEKTRAGLSAAGADLAETAQLLQVYVGRFDLGDLNAALGGSTGALVRLVQHAEAMRWGQFQPAQNAEPAARGQVGQVIDVQATVVETGGTPGTPGCAEAEVRDLTPLADAPSLGLRPRGG